MPKPSAVVYDLFGHSDDIQEIEDQGLSDTLRGRYAEFMVCAQLSQAGYYVTHVDGVGFDLVIKTDSGSYTIQVKGTARVHQGRCKWTVHAHDGSSNGGRNIGRKRRSLRPSDADLLALFHHIYGTTVIMPIRSDMPQDIYLSLSQVEHASIDESFRHSLAILDIGGS